MSAQASKKRIYNVRSTRSSVAFRIKRKGGMLGGPRDCSGVTKGKRGAGRGAKEETILKGGVRWNFEAHGNEKKTALQRKLGRASELRGVKTGEKNK